MKKALSAIVAALTVFTAVPLSTATVAASETSATEHIIRVNYNEDRGEVTVFAESAEAGETVWFEVDPGSKYHINYVRVYAGSEDIFVEPSSSGKSFSFTMPDKITTIYVDFGNGRLDKQSRDIGIYDNGVGAPELSTYEAKPGEIVYVYPVIDDEREIRSVYLTNAEGVMIMSGECVRHDEDSWFFFMPAGDVYVRVNYAQVNKPHRITARYNEDYGTVTMSAKTAYRFEEIIVDPTPYPEYSVTSVEVTTTTESGGKEVTTELAVTKKSDGTYSFKMPNSAVKVDVEFVHESDLGKEYKITYNYDTSRGDYTDSFDTYKLNKGTVVNIRPTPKKDCKSAGVTVTSDKTKELIPVYAYKDGDGEVFSFVMPAENVTAKLDFVKTGTPTYNVECVYDENKGAVYASVVKTAGGVKVYVYTEAYGSYELDSIKAACEDGTELTLIETETGYYFKMPFSAVTVSAEFALPYTVSDKATEAVTDNNDIEAVKAPEKSTHSVKLGFDGTKGQAALTHIEAEAGDTVGIGVTPLDGYSVGAVVASYEADGELKSAEVSEAVKNAYYLIKMPENEVHITVVFEAAPVITEKPLTYSDIPNGAWYSEAVEYVTAHGIMNGYAADIFAPEDTTTRAMIATVLWRLEGAPAPDAALTFTDVKADAWYTDAVRWAAANGIVNGKGDDTFAPEEAVTREQLAAMVYRYATAKGTEDASLTVPLPYNDLADISDWALESVVWTCTGGMLTATDGHLRPLVPATRAEVAYLLMKYLTI